jgi:hypothetical protein
MMPAVEAETELAREAQCLVKAYSLQNGMSYGSNPQDYAAGRAILGSMPRLQAHVVFALLEREGHMPWRFYSLLERLFARSLPWTAADLERLLTAVHEKGTNRSVWSDWSGVVRQIERFVKQGNQLTETMVTELQGMRCYSQGYQCADARRLHARVNELLGENRVALPDPWETWTDVALVNISKLPTAVQEAWMRLFALAQVADGPRPKPAWSKEARLCIAAVGDEAFREHVVRWFAAVTMPAMHTVQEEYNGREIEYQESCGTDRNISLLKGLAWMCAGRTEVEVVRALARLVESCLKKQPGVGPWALRAATAAIWALTEMECAEAIGQLGRLNTKVTSRTALGQIEKGLQAAAQRAGVTKAELEDLSVPAFGFDATGVRRETFGDCAAVATLKPDGEITVEWFNATGKPVKSVPAEVRKGHSGALKEFKADVEAAATMLSAQKTRFDAFYLPERVWTLRNWQERFAAHPILRRIALRLIWQFSEGGRTAEGLWNEERAGFCGADDAPIEGLTDRTEVRLWHPISCPVETVLAWRNALQRHGIQQPFKQAYREVYLLTEAERRTQTYSNRFAGHLLKQHQMNSLAILRGWHNSLRLMVDDNYPPATKEFADLGLRAEFWIEGASDTGDADTTASGTYLYLTTDQVRFYRLDAPQNHAHASGGGYYGGTWQGENPTPLPLSEVPALVFSEVMRDVDLFVGVCSVGNDPAWQDGGPQGRYRNYWSEYSFGDLSETARTRRTVLERLVPRLKIAARCSLTDRFLVVRGDLRTYKIHLGSGNILMEPNDQYLCIVQDRSAATVEMPVRFLPFEGDQRLALILSKAFLLAEDTRITDPTILKQIQP